MLATNPQLSLVFAGTGLTDYFQKQKDGKQALKRKYKNRKYASYHEEQLSWFQIINTSCSHAAGEQWWLFSAFSMDQGK